MELLLSKDAAEVAQVLAATGGQLLQTQLPKLTRFLILEDESGGRVPEPLREDCRVVTYDHFMDAFVDVDRHLADVLGLYPSPAGLSPGPAVPARMRSMSRSSGDVLTTDDRSGQMRISKAGAASRLLEELAASGGNLLIVGRPGSGKTTLLKRLVAAAPGAAARRYRFFFDMSLKRRDEPFAEFVARTLAPFMAVETAYVFPVFHYFARAGSVLCALDGIDEAVTEMTQAGFLELFGDLAQVLSAESAVVTTSRVSFLEDSPEVRRLLDGTSLMPEKLVQQLHAQGVDPLKVPRFSVLLLDEAAGGSPLVVRVAAEVGAAHQGDLGSLLWTHITQVAGSGDAAASRGLLRAGLPAGCHHLHSGRAGQ